MHHFKFNDLVIVVDPASASVHVVDDVALFLIQEYKNYDRNELIKLVSEKFPNENIDEIKSCYDYVTNLIKSRQLYTEDLVVDVGKILNKSQSIKAMCLHVATTCNLNCSYCFAKASEYHGRECIMSLSTAKRSIDFLIENSKGRHNLEVDFFGGEPLLNWDVCKGTIEYARKIEKDANKNFRFTLTTNGMLINDEIIDYLNKECHNVVLSLDGRKYIHDHFRKSVSGSGSYDKVVKNFKRLADKREHKGYYIRGTYTANNLDFFEDIKHMLDLGFKELSLEPVVTDDKSEYAIKEKDFDVIAEQYDKLANEIIKAKKENREFTFYHYILDLQHGPCIYKRTIGCGAGFEYVAVTPQGDLYPCHQFLDDKDYLLGNIYDGIKRKDICDRFKNTTLYSKQECKECWARMFCAGGCMANAYHKSGDINGIYEFGCKLFKKRLECAIGIQVTDSLDS